MIELSTMLKMMAEGKLAYRVFAPGQFVNITHSLKTYHTAFTEHFSSKAGAERCKLQLERGHRQGVVIDRVDVRTLNSLSQAR